MAGRTLGPEQQTDPPSVGYAVTASDATNDPNGPFRALSCTAAGVQFSGHFVRIWSTGTAATDVVGWR
jgi:hypothetical protein